MFFYDRYQNNMIANKQAELMKPKLNNVVSKLNKEKNYPIAELTFINEGLQEVVKSRQVLAWTYVYGYYLTNKKHKILFEDY